MNVKPRRTLHETHFLQSKSKNIPRIRRAGQRHRFKTYQRRGRAQICLILAKYSKLSRSHIQVLISSAFDRDKLSFLQVISGCCRERAVYLIASYIVTSVSDDEKSRIVAILENYFDIK